MKLMFNKDNGYVMDVGIEVLQETRDFTAIGRGRQHPIHYKTIAHIMGIVNEIFPQNSNYKAELSKLWISDKGGQQLKDNPDPDHPNSFLIQRVYSRIDLNCIDDDKYNMAIGILFNEKGYNIAFGINVRECTNFTVYGDHFLSTYGNYKKADHTAIMDALRTWLLSIEQKRSWYYLLVGQLMKIHITNARAQEIIGDLLQKACARNNGYTKEDDPGLNQTQVAELALAHYQLICGSQPRLYVSAWEFLNLGTNLLKPRETDLADIQTDVLKFNEYIIQKHFHLEDQFEEVIQLQLESEIIPTHEAGINQPTNLA